MHILITGAQDFIGRNLLAHLKHRAEQTKHTLHPLDRSATEQQLATAVADADFVFHLAEISPAPLSHGQDAALTTTRLLEQLETAKQPPVLMACYEPDCNFAEMSLFQYSQRTGSPVYLYRLPQVFGKWSRPGPTNLVATLCTQLTRGFSANAEHPEDMVQLTYIDDVITAFLGAMEGQVHPSSGICTVEPVYTLSQSELADRLLSYRDMRNQLDVPDQSDPLTHKLYATYLSFLPPDDFARTPVIHSDHRGSFTELLHMGGYGQISLNVSKPGIIKGEHWHRTKHEKFIVIQGHGVIRLRKPDDPTIISYKVDGDTRTVVDIPPGYIHNIENLGNTDMLTLMWINERFDPASDDAYPLPVTLQAPEKPM